MIDIRVDPHPSNAELTALWQAVWGQPGPPDFADMLSRSLAHVGGYVRNRLVGFVNVAWDGGEHASIFDVGVHPDYRRRGIATGMVREATRLAGERGAHWLHVDFKSELTSLYRGCGFRPTEAGIMRLR